MVDVEEYENKMYAVKFYLRKYKDCRNPEVKFFQKTGLFDARKILNTCLNIMLEFYEKDPFASFYFSGVPTIEENAKMMEDANSVKSTQRFRVYQDLMNKTFSPVHFHHIPVPPNQFFLLNKEALIAFPKLQITAQRLLDTQ